MLLAILIFVLTVVVLLVTAGDDGPEEVPGDLTYLEGSVRGTAAQGSGQLVASIADLTAAEVRPDGNLLVFEATVAAPLPQRLKKSALEFRWDISGETGESWTLTITMDRIAKVSLFSGAGYGAGTVDHTFPGDLTVEDDRIEARLDPAQIDDFPEAFDWTLSTTLRAFRNEPDSPRVEDRFPDQDSATFES